MSNQKYEMMVYEYFDGELSDTGKQQLFTRMATDISLRLFFDSVKTLKMTIKETTEEFPESLERKILHQIGTEKKPKLYKLEPRYWISVAAIVILFITSISLFMQMRSYRMELETIMTEVQNQNRTIKALYNSIPQVEVKAEEKEEQIIVKANL